MAKITTKKTAVTFTVELSLNEMLILFYALDRCSSADLEDSMNNEYEIGQKYGKLEEDHPGSGDGHLYKLYKDIKEALRNG